MAEGTQTKTHRDDPVWESVLESLAHQGYLARFYKIPRHELAAMIKLYSSKGVPSLGYVFSLTQSSRIEDRERFIDKLSDQVRYVMLAMLVRSMRCWVETETFQVGTARLPWKVAHS